jgi:gliding motility-associated-like protein
LLLLLGSSVELDAKHIVGGEIIYDDLGAGNYRITLKIYRDCFSDGAPFDGVGQNAATALLTVFDIDSNLIGTFDIGAPVITNIPPTINNPCIQIPTNVCVEEGVYTYTLNLPPIPGGYHVIYQRCCRNNSIINLAAPGNQGSTYYTHIPGTDEFTVNSSPRFKKFPPIFLCANVPFTFDHSALDPDGDNLTYSLFTPFQGLDANCPSLGPSGCPTNAPPPLYPNVAYTGSYSGSYPIDANPAFVINPTTGLLTGRPTQIGQYVVGICCVERRNGQIVNVHFRDFQFNVTSCVVNVAAVFQEPTKMCQGRTISFVNQSFGNVGALTYHWDFGVNGTLSDTSQALNPTFTFPDTGSYNVVLIANPGKACSDTMTKKFYIFPDLNVNFTHPGPQCLRPNSFTFINNSIHDPSATWMWNFTPTANPATSTSFNQGNVVYSTPGKFLIKLLGKQFSCRDSMTDTIRVFDKPHAKINNFPPSLCDPATIGFSNGSWGELPMRFNWTFSDGRTTDNFEPVYVFSPPGVYSATLVAITTSLCIDTGIAIVKNFTVNPTPKAAFSFSPQVTTIFDPTITVTNRAGDNVVQWNYETGDGGSNTDPSFYHEYLAVGRYPIKQTVTNAFGCWDTLTQFVKIDPEYRFWIPNTFTPNGDGMNDIFKPEGIGWLDYDFDIYDRWGEKLFTTSQTVKGWDGTYKGKPCKQDVYVYRITFTNEVNKKAEEHFGHVNLLAGEK